MMMLRSITQVWFWLLLLLLGYVATGFYQVRPGEVGIVRRFGRVQPELAGPGLHWGWPWGLDRIDRIAIDERRQLVVGYVETDDPNKEYLPVGQVLTGDNHLLNVLITVYYTVDPKSAVSFMLNQDKVDMVIARWAEEGFVLALAGEKIDAVLLGDAHHLEARMQAHLSQAMQRLGIGVRIEQINIHKVQPPTELVEVYLEVNRARTQRDIVEREAIGMKNTEISMAQQDALRSKSETRSRVHELLTQARAEADRFAYWLSQLPKDASQRQAALLRYYLDEMQQVFSRMQVRTASDLPLDQTVIQPGK